MTKKNISTAKRVASKYSIPRVAVYVTIFAIIGFATLKFSSAFTVQEDSPIRFSMGSESIETSDGNLWESVGYTADGVASKTSTVIAGTTEQALYQTQRTGITNLDVAGLPKGRYKVTLHFADTVSTAKGQRVFAIDAEGKEEQDELDIFRKSGAKTSVAYIYDFNVNVDDGTLNLDFKPIAGTPILSAFELLPRKLDKAQVGNIPEPTNPTPPPAPTPTTPVPTPVPTTPTPLPSIPLPNGGRQVNVTNSAQLAAAINGAQPGDVISLADGRYTGKKLVGKYTGSFSATVSGTADKPIFLKGSRNAVIDGDGTGGHYGLYLVGANYWRIQGLTVTDATKGIVLDGSNNVIMDGIQVTRTGQEGVHFRVNSSDNTIMNSEVSYTGAKNATYGEGVYIGSANSNWGTYNGGQPDRSDRNKVLNNKISFTGAESMDIKEGTTGGIIQGNVIDGREMTGSWADSWLDVKGNNYTITGNTGNYALQDGFQIHVAIKGWGNNNYFSKNTANVNGPGWGLSIQAGTTGNIWKCDNVVNGAVMGNAVVNGKTPFACTP